MLTDNNAIDQVNYTRKYSGCSDDLHSRFRAMMFRSNFLIFVLFAIWFSFPAACYAFIEGPKLTSFGTMPVDGHPDVVLIETLISTGLEHVADDLCASRMRMVPQDSDAFAQWSMLAMQVKAHTIANDISWLDSPEILEQKLKSVQDIASELSDGPRAAWIAWKSAWCRWYIQQQTLAAFLSVPGRDSVREWTLQSIRHALDDLDRIDRTIKDIKPTDAPSSQTNRTKKAITTAQVLSLQGDIELLKADLLLQRSHCYPTGHNDRIAAATELLSSIDRGALRLPSDWVLQPQLTIAKAAGLIQLGRFAEGIRTIESLWQRLDTLKDIPSERKLKWQMTMAGLASQAARELKDFDLATQWLSRIENSESIPELALERFAVQFQRDGESGIPAALRMKDNIAKRFGVYWQRRADALLVGNKQLQTGSTNPASLEIFRVEVRQLMAAKKWSDAIDKLRQAEGAASKAGALEAALDFAMQAAATIQKNQDNVGAANEFQQASKKYKQQTKASSAALMSAWLLQTAPQGTPQAEVQQLRVTYRQRLLDVIEVWPSSKDAFNAVDRLELDLIAIDRSSELIEFWEKHLSALNDAATANATSQSRTASTSLTAYEDRALSRSLLAFNLSHDAWLDGAQHEPDRNKDAEQLNKLNELLLSQASPSVRPELSKFLDSFGTQFLWRSTWIDVQFKSSRTGRTLMSLLSVEQGDGTDDFENLKDREGWADDSIGWLAVRWTACECLLNEIWIRSSSSSNCAKRLRSISDSILLTVKSPNELTLGKSIKTKLLQAVGYYSIVSKSLLDDRAAAIANLEKSRSANSKSGWWLYRSSRLLSALPGNEDQGIELLNRMSKGYPAGSIAWFESKARIVQALRRKGSNDKADELQRLLFAAYPDAEALWKPRLGR